MTARIRVLTQNLWGVRGDWAARREVLAAGLSEYSPDLIAFVESIKTEDYDQVRDLIGPKMFVQHQGAREPDGQGASIASRWPIRETFELDLHVTDRTSDFACTALVAEIEGPSPFGRVLFANHMPQWQVNFEVERERQALATARFLEERVREQPAHVVLAGDFGDAEASSQRFWAGRQSLDGTSVCYRDAWESAHGDAAGETFTPRNALVADWDWPFRRVDFVFIRCGDHGGPTLQVESCELAFDTPVGGVWASDHFGVLADLVPPHRRS
jgi:endonuclease/exonuclease/phosphatase family metal-dependent hydrolase